MAIKNKKLTYSLGKRPPSDLPGMYKDSKLFTRKHPRQEGSQYAKSADELPDSQLDPIEPVGDEKVSETRKAIQMLEAMKSLIPGGLAAGKKPSDFDPEQLKAGMKVEMEHTNNKNMAREIAMDHLTEDPNYYKKLKKIEKAESAGRTTMPSEKQAKREYDHSFARFPRGISGVTTPDLPERGRDWHGTVPGVPDEPQDDDKDQKESESYFSDPKDLLKPTSVAKSINKEALDQLSQMPVFTRSQCLNQKEKDFLLSKGYHLNDIRSGNIMMRPWQRNEYNRWLANSIVDSICKSLKPLER